MVRSVAINGDASRTMARNSWPSFETPHFMRLLRMRIAAGQGTS